MDQFSYTSLKSSPPGKETISKIKAVKVLYDQRDKTVHEIADDLSISRATAYRFLKVANQWEKELKN